MEKILFIYAPFSKPLWHSWIPLGIASIAGYLRRHGYEIHVLDYNATSFSLTKLQRVLSDFAPDYVGISCTYGSLKGALMIASSIKDHSKIPVFMGGLPATFIPDQVFGMSKDVDIYVRGEGEDTVLELAENRELGSIKGISFQKDGELIHNEDRPFCNNIDKFGIPAYDLFPLKRYNNFPKSMLVESLRGCPFACHFCIHSIKEGRKVRTKSVELFIRELQEIQKYPFIKRIDFADSDFFLDKEHAYNILNAIIENKLNERFEFHTVTRVERLIREGEALIFLLKKSNVTSVFVGIESVSKKQINDLGKVKDLDAVVSIVRDYRQHKIEIQPSFIIGYFTENKEDMEETLKFAMNINAKIINVGLSTPYPGTPLYQRCLDNDLIINHNLDLYDNQHQIVKHQDDLEELLLRFRTRYHLRWSYLNFNSLASFSIFNLLRFRTLVYYLYNRIIGNY